MEFLGADRSADASAYNRGRGYGVIIRLDRVIQVGCPPLTGASPMYRGRNTSQGG
jgi:hypothetical protein